VLVLVIDTSSAAVVSAVVDVATPTAAVLAARSPLAARGHTELLTPGIAECLTAAGATPRDIRAVVAGTGPGPYTGLRVGLATAAAFADAVGVATYGVCSLDAIAAQDASRADDAGPTAGDLLVATDARRREVYWARYDARGERVTGPAVDRPADVPLTGITDVAGAGGELYAETWPQLDRLPYRYPSAQCLAVAAADRVRAHAPAEALTPHYLRRPDAVVPGASKTVSQ
jgi:tRNA threonylcarbamoyl adenosine modification protein YeaZ